MKKNGMGYFSTVTFFTIVLFITINIYVGEAKMTMAQIRNALKPVYKTCITKSGVSKEVVAKTHEGEFPPDPALQCYYACLYKQMKIMGKDDKIDISIVLKQIDLMMPENIAVPTKEVSQLCYEKITSNESCESSWQYSKCFFETDSSLYFLP